MVRIKDKAKDVIYSIGFLFRPITPVAVSFVFLVLTCTMLIVIITKLDESSKAYEVLLAILTGVTASLLIAIMMELYNNYRFNTKRQRELREYFGNVAGYELHQKSITDVNSKYEPDCALGNGRAYAVFQMLGEIIPALREALNNRDYLYRVEINEIDDILYNYNNIVKAIWVGSLGAYMGFISPKHDDTGEGKTKEEDESNVDLEKDEMGGDELTDDESIMDYSELFNFLKTEAMYHAEGKYNPDFYDEAPEQLESVIEKAIFNNRHIFNEYFEITDARCKLAKLADDKKLPYKERGFEFRSNMISKACSDIDKSMIKLQKRVAKEPYFWTVASYKEKN